MAQRAADAGASATEGAGQLLWAVLNGAAKHGVAVPNGYLGLAKMLHNIDSQHQRLQRSRPEGERTDLVRNEVARLGALQLAGDVAAAFTGADPQAAADAVSILWDAGRKRLAKRLRSS